MLNRKREAAQPPAEPSAGHGSPGEAYPMLEPLLGVHSAPDTAWLADAASTASERGLGALYGLLYLIDASLGRLCGERPASSERVRGLARLNQELGTDLMALKIDPGQTESLRVALDEGRAKSVPGLADAFELPIGQEQVLEGLRRLGVAQVWLAPLEWNGESQGLLVLLMPADPPGSIAQAELLGRHLAVALKNLRDKEAGRKRGELDAVRWVYDEHRLNEQLSKEISRAGRHQRALSLLVLRINNLQEIRLRHGRFLCERLLRQVGARMEDTMRYTDFLGAYGDSGFAGILVEADQAAAGRARERVLEALEHVTLPQADLPDFRLDLACATATLAVDGESAAELASAAQQRLEQPASRDAA